MNPEIITQNTDYTTIIAIFVGVIAVVVAIATQNTNQSKRFEDLTNNMNSRFDALKDEFVNFKIEVKTDLNNLSMRVERLEFKFDGIETGISNTNTKVDTVKEQVNDVNIKVDTVKEQVEKITTTTENNSIQINKIETENKTFIDKIFDKLELPKDVLTPKTTVL